MRTFICRAIQLAIAAGVSGSPVLAQQADSSLTGTWESGPITSDVAIESWTDSCDEAPKARGSAGGFAIEIEQRGEKLSVRGSGIRSGQCGSNPKLRQVGVSYNDGVWVTRCATEAGEARGEQGTYTLRSLGPDRLLYQEVSHLNWRIGSTVCRATLTSKQSLVRRAAATKTAPAQPSAPAQAAQATAAPPGCKPGAPARVSLRPREAELELGQKLCLQVKVEDQSGCPIPDVPLAWSLEHKPAIRGTLQGNCFQAGERSAEAEGHFEVLAAAGAVRGRATVHVVAHTLRELTAKPVDNVGVLPAREPYPSAPSGASGADQSTTRFAARALGQEERGRQRLLMGLAALLAVAAAVIALARRPKRRPSGPNSIPTPAPTRRCPSCGALYPDTIAFCGNDGTALQPVRRS